MIDIRAFNAHPKYRSNLSETKQLARKVFKREHRNHLSCSIIYVHDTMMTKLNGTYLDHWYATDVLTFTFHEASERELSGEIYVNLDQARRQAKEYRVTIKEETARLVIHGALHLIGYKDGSSVQKKKMTNLENTYLRQLL